MKSNRSRDSISITNFNDIQSSEDPEPVQMLELLTASAGKESSCFKASRQARPSGLEAREWSPNYDTAGGDIRERKVSVDEENRYTQ